MKRIVVCGSAKLKEKIINLGERLVEKGYEVVISREIFVKMEKADASKLHFDEINNELTDIVLAMNETKNGIENYIRTKYICRNSDGILLQ